MDGKIWVIVRSEGEYSDRHETCVFWFPSETAAKAFVERATGESRQAAQKWRAFEDQYARDVPDDDYKKFMSELAIVDTTFNPTGWEAEYASYYIREVNRGALC